MVRMYFTLAKHGYESRHRRMQGKSIAVSLPNTKLIVRISKKLLWRFMKNQTLIQESPTRFGSIYTVITTPLELSYEVMEKVQSSNNSEASNSIIDISKAPLIRFSRVFRLLKLFVSVSKE